MNQAVREWLPAGALTGDPVLSAIGEAVEHWSAAWFASARLHVAGVDEGVRAWTMEGGALRWRSFGDAVAVASAPKSAATLVARALAAKPGQEAATERDRTLLEGFERRMFRNLASRIEVALGLPGNQSDSLQEAKEPGCPPPGLTVRICDEKGEAVRLSIAFAPVIAFRKSRIAAAAPGRERMAGLLDAVSPVRVKIEARLGRAEIPLADLRGLAAGDVLVLDHMLSEPVDLSLAGSGRRFARARLAEADGRMALTLEG